VTDLHPSVTDIAAAALRLSVALADADEAQWQRSRTVTPDDTEANDYNGGSLASRGQHSDPTFDAVADPARLALRAAVVGAESDLTRLVAVMDSHTQHVQTALDRWNGGL
jgi:hypothetical protein